jgi:hypothetical protein
MLIGSRRANHDERSHRGNACTIVVWFPVGGCCCALFACRHAPVRSIDGIDREHLEILVGCHRLVRDGEALHLGDPALQEPSGAVERVLLVAPEGLQRRRGRLADGARAVPVRATEAEEVDRSGGSGVPCASTRGASDP